MSDVRFNPKRPNVVITKAGVAIGSAHVPPPAPMGSEAARIQEVLLAKPAPFAERVLDAIDRNWPALFVASTVAGCAIGAVRKGLL